MGVQLFWILAGVWVAVGIFPFLAVLATLGQALRKWALVSREVPGMHAVQSQYGARFCRCFIMVLKRASNKSEVEARKADHGIYLGQRPHRNHSRASCDSSCRTESSHPHCLLVPGPQVPNMQPNAQACEPTRAAIGRFHFIQVGSQV